MGGAGASGEAGAGGSGGSRAPDIETAGKGGMTAGAAAPAAGRGEAGASGGSGGGAAGSAAAAGSGGMAPAPAAVSGRVIDLYRRPVVGVELHIGDKQVTTDDQGRFSLDGVAATYDVAFKFETYTSGEPTTFAWLFEGISRRDPTLQVYRSADFQKGEITWHAAGVTFPLPSDQYILAGFGCPDGDGFQRLTAADTTLEVSWIGPLASSRCVTHALQYRASSDNARIVEYLAHSTTSVTLSSSMPAQASLSFGGTKLLDNTISGNVIAPGEGARTNWARIRWNDGTFLPIAEETPTSETFSYRVPMLPDANIMIVGLRGMPGGRPLALAIADNLTPGMTNVELRVPNWPSLTEPADAKMAVDGDTLFQWSTDSRVSVLVAVAKEGNDSMYVVTANKEAHLAMRPRVPYTPRAGSSFDWFVATHGDFASMDEATGSDGFISGYSYAQVHGPRRGNGSFTSSAGRSFTTPP
ncbi:MAG TPA: carboxypeptidase-like regulatory domain-containing protein [Polyangiales bacterium]|nr:carboxypeptidase-like regulatory domain-containing protein [Polyangiales bacterium]